MSNKKKDTYEDLGKLDHKNSWLQNTVELAALGTILTGAGTLAVKGDFSDALKGGKRAIGTLGKGWENYVMNRGSLPLKFGVKTIKKTYGNLRKMNPENLDEAIEMHHRATQAINKINTDPQIQKNMRFAVKRKLSFIDPKEIDAVLDGTNLNHPKATRIRTAFEEVKAEERGKILGISPQQNGNRKGNRNQQQKNGPLFNNKELARNAIINGVAGLSFAGGISGFHAIDRLSSNPDAQKNVENAFDYAGSFINKRDDKKMDKKAGALEIYNAIKDAPKKFPEAIFSGLGFTGVSLATAKALGHDPKKFKEDDDGNSGPRVIIELGNPTSEDHHTNLGTPPSLGGLPKLSSSDGEGIKKLAAPSFQGFKNFLKDFRGYDDEVRHLESLNHSDLAAEQLKDADIASLLKSQYGNLVNDKTESQFTTRLFDSRAAQLKNESDDRIRELQSLTANARLKAGAGTLATGGGLAALSSLHKKENENV